jgi:hypothetical protein
LLRRTPIPERVRKSPRRRESQDRADRPESRSPATRPTWVTLELGASRI